MIMKTDSGSMTATAVWAAASWSDSAITYLPAPSGSATFRPSCSLRRTTSGLRSSTTWPSVRLDEPVGVLPEDRDEALVGGPVGIGPELLDRAAARGDCRRRPRRPGGRGPRPGRRAGRGAGAGASASCCCTSFWSYRELTSRTATAPRTSSSARSSVLRSTQLSVSSAWRCTQIVSEQTSDQEHGQGDEAPDQDPPAARGRPVRQPMMEPRDTVAPNPPPSPPPRPPRRRTAGLRGAAYSRGQTARIARSGRRAATATAGDRP